MSAQIDTSITLNNSICPEPPPGTPLPHVPGFDFTTIVPVVTIPAGSFFHETLNKQIGIERDMLFSDTAVTQAAWEAIMGYNRSQTKGPNIPVTNVNFYECILFCNRLSRLSGYPVHYFDGDKKEITQVITSSSVWVEKDPSVRGIRLPDEHEWMWHTFGAGDTQEFLIENAVHNREEITEVRTLLPNGFGVYDSLGLVWCWTQTPRQD